MVPPMPSTYPRTAKPALIIGSVAIDRIATSVTRTGDILGGAATYASIAASYFAPRSFWASSGRIFQSDSFKDFASTASTCAASGWIPRGRPFSGRAVTGRFSTGARTW